MSGSRGATTIATEPACGAAIQPGSMEGPAVRLPNQKVADAVMIMLTDHGNGLPDQRMEWTTTSKPGLPAL